MTKSAKTMSICILAFPGHQASCAEGLADLFTIANMSYASFEPQESRSIQVEVVDAVKAGSKRKFDIVIIPSSLNRFLSTSEAKPWAQWLKEQHRSGAVLSSVCTGAFLLAETGLLEKRKITTHWFFENEFKGRFQDIEVDIDQMVIDDGDIMTAGGMMAWVDLGLKLVESFFGSVIMMKTAKFLLVDPSGREQRFYNQFSPNFLHGDEDILRVQHWLQKTSAKESSMQAMVSKAHLEERTFIRRFQKATGHRPTEYCQQVRISKARELLEFTKKTIDQISWDVGYEDAGSFRKIFHRHLGLTPSEYRLKFFAKR